MHPHMYRKYVAIAWLNIAKGKAHTIILMKRFILCPGNIFIVLGVVFGKVLLKVS